MTQTPYGTLDEFPPAARVALESILTPPDLESIFQRLKDFPSVIKEFSPSNIIDDLDVTAEVDSHEYMDQIMVITEISSRSKKAAVQTMERFTEACQNITEDVDDFIQDYFRGKFNEALQLALDLNLGPDTWDIPGWIKGLSQLKEGEQIAALATLMKSKADPNVWAPQLRDNGVKGANVWWLAWVRESDSASLAWLDECFHTSLEKPNNTKRSSLDQEDPIEIDQRIQVMRWTFQDKHGEARSIIVDHLSSVAMDPFQHSTWALFNTMLESMIGKSAIFHQENIPDKLGDFIEAMDWKGWAWMTLDLIPDEKDEIPRDNRPVKHIENKANYYKKNGIPTSLGVTLHLFDSAFSKEDLQRFRERVEGWGITKQNSPRPSRKRL